MVPQTRHGLLRGRQNAGNTTTPPKLLRDTPEQNYISDSLRYVGFALMGTAMLGISIPNFVVAPLLILGLAVYGGWLPAGGWDWSWQRMVLPVVNAALPEGAEAAAINPPEFLRFPN